MQSIALVIHVILAVAVIGLVLMQHGKGADAGAAFGSGASATVFGAGGSASFLTRATTALATLFFVTSLFLFYLAAHRDGSVRSVTDSVTDIPGIVDEVEPAAAPSDLPGIVDDAGDTAADAAGGSSGDSASEVQAPASESDLPTPAE